ncbi:putative FERM and PDZ domain-containing protein 1-like [Scophthalmus maximus]|uniref:Putative FERM and PDZ domain-containing protein 1-like n=1 Tax=Scophthalmus maximus TaxID=52904 RepID=A0A2U9BQI0_SCOMX|nr:putative FERM and PDZ domain-containing protein 1-like [Scophthalmus maximus]
MEVQDRSRSPSRRTSRVEQVVGRWLRRSRDLGSRSHSLTRDRVAVDGKTAESSGSDQRNFPFRFNIQIQRDPTLNSHGLTLSSQSPILVQEVAPGGPADGRLVPGDQLVKINNVAVDDLTPEQAAEIIRECQDTLTMTVLRTMLGPKSSFITPEKRAKLRSNPVKVHFAQEVEVNGHCQGNSLLFLPNVLKVYLENGQTKAFKFEPSTTVKDIVMTLKEKLSLSRIEHFSLVLEQQHSISKLLLLHDEERIQQVVQKKEAHDYRCLFRVCFLHRNLQTLLQEDPTAFEYLYLQGVNDVLQERFAVEMRCNTALRLAALHIQERLASCGHSPKTNLKIIMKTWGIENFVSSTLLRNMREKDLRKAISYHMKKSQTQNDPKQKSLSVNQARINYLEELADLKSFGGKSFSATMMLQDRESMVTLLVGARYGVSQVVNHKLSILSALTEFTCITRIELLPESDKVSLVKIYLQDIKPITLLLESMAAKDMSCLIAGYCRVFVDPSLNIFPWIDDPKKHRVSAEEGYVSRCCSDSDDSSDLDMEPLVTLVSLKEKPCPRARSSSDPDGRKRKDRRRVKDGKEKSWEDKKQNEEKDADTEKEKSLLDKKTEDPSDSCQTDSRVLTSPSSDSLDALEEDDLLMCSSSSSHLIAPSQTHPDVLSPLQSLHCVQKCSSDPCSDESSLCFAELSRLVDFLPSPPEASDDEEEEEEELRRRRRKMLKEMDQLSDARCYYKLCSNITPDSARSLPRPLHHNEGEDWEEVEGDEDKAEELEPIPILQPPPGFGDSSSDEEFFDARDRFASPEDPTAGALPRDICTEMKLDFLSTVSLSDIRVSVTDGDNATEDKDGGEEEGGGRETLFQLRKRSRKRRSFMETDYTSMVSYPEPNLESKHDRVSNRLHKNLLAEAIDAQMLSSDPEPSEQTQNPSPTVSSLTHSEGEPTQLESKPILSKACSHGPRSPGFVSHEQTREPQPPSRTRKKEMEMEPDTMESKSVTALVKATSPTITVVRCRVDPDGKESGDRREIAEEVRKGEDIGEERIDRVRGYSSKTPLVCPDRQLDANTLPTCLMDMNKKGSNVFLASHLIAKELNSNVEEHKLEGVCDKSNPASYSPPPPPPSSPLPPVPVFPKSPSHYLEREEEENKNMETSTQISSMELPLGKENHTKKAQLHLQFPLIVNEDEAIRITCSSSIMGRLSASTLRGKIQNLPLYLSRSQENLHQAGVENVAQSPSEDGRSQNVEITIKVTDVEDVTQTIDSEMDTTAETVDSDDSDTTVTGSEVDGEYFVATTLIASHSGLELKEVDSSLPIQTEPKPQHQHQPLYPIQNTPGPITEPPASIVNSLQRDTSDMKTDIPGPIKLAPEPNTVTTPVYTNCFSGGDSFDDELTVYEFSRRTQSSGVTEASGAGFPLMTSPPVPLLSTSSTHSPSFPRSILFSSSTSELSPLLSPLSDTSNCFLSRTHKDTISRLGQQRYPEPPMGFQELRVDVDQLLSILEGSGSDRSVVGHGGRHPRDTCPAHFTENKRVLQIEARRLMSSCQKVVGIGQSPEEMLHSLADSFRTLVELAGLCLWFSGCDRCDRRNAEAVAGLADVARSFRDFCLAAERASSKRSCQDLSTKLLAKQCTALTASVFCLTQLFRTLTAL